MDNFNLKKYLAESELLKEYKYLRTTEKDVNVFVTIKNNKLIDDYKIQQYVNELGEFIQNHINKGDLAENNLTENKGLDLAKDVISKAREAMKKLTDEEVEAFRKEVANAFDLK